MVIIRPTQAIQRLAKSIQPEVKQAALGVQLGGNHALELLLKTLTLDQLTCKEHYMSWSLD